MTCKRGKGGRLCPCGLYYIVNQKSPPPRRRPVPLYLRSAIQRFRKLLKNYLRVSAGVRDRDRKRFREELIRCAKEVAGGTPGRKVDPQSLRAYEMWLDQRRATPRCGWGPIYRECIPEYASLSSKQRSRKQVHLRARVRALHWRRRAKTRKENDQLSET